jgi:plastocyanin
MGRALSAAGVAALLLVFAPGSADAAVIQIKMAQIAFAPAQVSAHVGDTIEWTNDDIVAHTATARNGDWDVMVQPKGKASITLKSAGTIEYYCRVHPNMVGSILVSQQSPE